MSLEVILDVLFVWNLGSSISYHKIIVLNDVIVLLRSWLTVTKRDDEEIWFKFLYSFA